MSGRMSSKEACPASQVAQKVAGHYLCSGLELPSIFLMEQQLLNPRAKCLEAAALGAFPHGHNCLFPQGSLYLGTPRGQGLSLGASMKQIHQQDPKTLVFLIFSLISVLEPQLLCLGCSIHHGQRKHLGVAAVAGIAARPRSSLPQYDICKNMHTQLQMHSLPPLRGA